ncbi:MAG: protein kinase [Luteitalea sp.]|nr:protein kinase [Luteitalea sp.]
MLRAVSQVAQRYRALTSRTRTEPSAFDTRGHASEGDADGPRDSPAGTIALAGGRDLKRPARNWGHLRLIEPLGQGSFGEVYHAYDPQLDRHVALKLFGRRPETEAKHTQRVLSEGRLLARVRHPNIVAVYGTDVHDGQAGLWMELVKGGTLEARLQREGLCGPQEALFIAQDLCRALAAVHRGGLLHRDIKAQNVMREEGGRIVLMDFGTAALQEAFAASRQSRLVGTPIYVAPEVLAGAPPSVHSDLYSVGVLLFHLVTGSFPVKASSIADLYLAHTEGRRTFLHDARADLPDAFVRLVERALSPDPRDRHPTAGAMQAALSQAAGIEQPKRQVQDGRRVIVAALLSSALIAGGVGAVWYLPNRTDTAAHVAVTPHVPLLAVRPVLTGVPEADSVTRAVVEDVRRRLAASSSWRVSSSQAVEVLNTPQQSTLAIMTTLATDAAAEISVEPTAEGLRGEIRVLRAGLAGRPSAATVSSAGGDVNRLVDVITQHIATTLQWELEQRSVSQRSRIAAVAQEARMHYLEGVSLLHRYGVQNLEAALSEFRAAGRFEPTFALAHAMTARTILQLYQSGALQPVDNPEGMARHYIARALEHDEACAEAYAALGNVYALEHQWDAADQAFQTALSLSPSLESARTQYALFLAGRGKLDDALAQVTEARVLDPYNAAILGYTGMMHHYRGEHEEAIAQLQSAVRIDPSHTHPQTGLCRVFSALGRVPQGVYHCEEAKRAGTLRPTAFEAQMVQLYAVAGDLSRARRHMQRLRSIAGTSPKPDAAYFLAIAHTALGQKEQALSYLRLALEGGAPALYPGVDPRLAALRSSVEFDEIIARADAGRSARSNDTTISQEVL